MKRYKVIALSVSGKGSKIHNSGEIVYENNFNRGRADELVIAGFLKHDGEIEKAPEGMTETEDLEEGISFSKKIMEDQEKEQKAAQEEEDKRQKAVEDTLAKNAEEERESAEKKKSGQTESGKKNKNSK